MTGVFKFVYKYIKCIKYLVHKLHRKIVMKLTANIMAILLVVLACFFGHAEAEGEESTPEVTPYAIELINKIRLDPLAYAESLGYDREKLTQDLPWMAEFLTKGLPPLVSSSYLNGCAEAKNSEENASAETAVEPDPPKVQYDFSLTGEFGGVVSFYNFMPSDFAWEIIIRNQFEQEIKPDRVEPIYILNPGFDSVGIAVRGGVHPNSDGEIKNAYFATIWLASSRLKSEVQVFNMVNQVRSNPHGIELYRGKSLLELVHNNLDLLSEWSRPCPPLMDSSTLHKYARDYSRQIVNPGEEPFFASDSTPSSRALEMGYEGSKFAETYTTLLPVKVTSGEIAAMVFSSLVDEEFKNLSDRKAIFFLDTGHGGLGISFAGGAEGQEEISFSSVLCAGIPNKDPLDGEKDPSVDGNAHPQAGIYGVVYSDRDENGLVYPDNNGNKIYSPGEDIEGASIAVIRKSDGITVSRVYTDRAGHFSMSLDVGEEYRFEISAGELSVPLEMLVDKDLFLPVNLFPQLESSQE